jgi:exocyst complex protein 7
MASTYATLVNPVVNLFSSTLSSLSALIKRSLPKYTFLALACYESLSVLQPLWDDAFARGKRDSNELKEGLHSLRAVCLRSFPEFLADIKLAATGKGNDSTGLADVVTSVWTIHLVETVLKKI